jgi:predicted AAA+ superfamily ATPase
MELTELSNTFQDVMITVSRQVGKSTVLNIMSDKAQDKINIVSLDDLKIRTMAVEDPELFLRTYEPPLIIDEFQYAPNILPYIKIIVDKKRLENLNDNKIKYNGLYYLTGSQIFNTMKDVSESLAGRVGIIDMYGLSNREIYSLKEEKFIPSLELLKERKKREPFGITELFERIIKGSYPELYKEETQNYEKFYSAYVKTYIERDIRQLINVQDELKFLKFISSVAARTAQELNLNDICKEVEISVNTASEWLSILVSTGIVYLLQPYSNNNIARIVKTPKIYFMDTGLACYLTGYTNGNILEKSAYNGAIFETFVITEIIKSFANAGLDSRKYLYYYRDNNKKEIDLLIIYNRTIYPIEIKKSSNPNKDAIKHFDIIKKFGIDVGNGGVICMTKDLFPIDRENNLIPIELL